MTELSVKVDGVPAPILVETGYVVVRESTDFFLPSATLVFKDRLSGFVSHYPFMQDTEIELGIDDGQSIKVHRFFAFSSKKEQNMEGVESFDIHLDMISKYSDPLLVESEFHSMRGTASDYIRYIAEKCGLRSDVEATKEVRSWINPNWKYSQMVRHLAQRSISSSGSGGYLYFVRGDGTLVFKSADKFFDEEEAIDLTVGSYEVVDGDETYVINNKQFTLKDNHFASVVLGNNSMETSIYDYMRGSRVVETVRNDRFIKKRGAVKGISLGMDSMGIKRSEGVWYSDEVDFPSHMYKAIYNKVLRQLESNQVVIMVPLKNEYKLGGVINLSVPANMDIFPGGVNLNHSGKYLIKAMNTVGHGDYMIKLVLVRPGISLPSERKVGYK